MSARRPAQTGQQSAEIRGWLPVNIANARLHWRSRHDAMLDAKDRAHRAALAYRWEQVTTPARLLITLVYPSRAQVCDVDNAYARCKGVIDGLKEGRWIVDDSPEWLDLRVEQTVERKTKAVRLELSEATRPATPPAEEGR